MSESFEARFKRLPARRAPEALKSRVLAAAALRQRRWSRRLWWTWSLPAQAAFVGGVALAAYAVLALAGPAAARVSAEATQWSGRFDWLAPVARALVRVLWAARLPLAALAVVCAAPAAALTGLAATHRSGRC